MIKKEKVSRTLLAAYNHDFCGLNQGVDRSADFQTQCSSRVAGDDRCNLLATDVDRHLDQKALKTELSYQTMQFVSTADRIQANRLSPLCVGAAVAGHTLNFTAGDAVMSSGSFGRVDLALEIHCLIVG
jgi:hypothetical protein